MLDIARLRDETPGCGDLLHFNNAGAALQPRPVSEAVLQHLMLEQRLGGYEAADHQAASSAAFYSHLATLLNCNPREIAWAENSTRAWSLLINAIPFERGDRIITSQTEYASNYLGLLLLARQYKLKIDVIPHDARGLVDLGKLESRLGDDVRLIALTHIASQNGVIQPVHKVGELARKHKILFLLDACQSIGQVETDVNTLGCDMLTASGRKYLRGPRGTGFLYVRHQILDYLKPTTVDLQSAQWQSRDHFDWRDDARRFEIWEQFTAGKIGLARAAEYACMVGMPLISDRIQKLGWLLRDQLSQIPGITVHDPGYQPGMTRADSRHLGGIVTFSSQSLTASKLQQALRQQRINVSVIRRQNTQLDFPARSLSEINRASVHYYNNEAEIQRFCDVLSAL